MEMQYRASVRGQLTKRVNEINDYLDNLASTTDSRESILETLNTNLCRIRSLHENLKEADISIRPHLEEKNYETEFNAQLEYADKAVTAIARIQHRLNMLQITPIVTNAELPPTQQSLRNEQQATSALKLPRLELKTFNGDFSNWLPFWQQFNKAVHLNPNLDEGTKFNFLQSVIKGRAADTIAGLTPTEACYNEAIAMLKEEYGAPDRIIDKYLQQLMSIKSVKTRTDATGLRNLYSSVTAAMRSLNALKVSPSQYMMMLKSIILRALPDDLRVEYHRIEAQLGNNRNEHNDEAGTHHTTLLDTSTHAIECDPVIKRVLNFIKIEAEALEKAAVTFSGERKSTHNRHHQATATGLFTLHQNSANCFFCESQSHTTANCDASNATVAERKEKLRSAGRCFRCTQPKHSSRYCKNKFIRCKKCNGRHATAVCDPDYKGKLQNDTVKEGYARKNVNIGEMQKKPNAVSLLSPVDETIFLQTGYGIVNKSAIRFILDSASTRTYICEHVSRRLKLPVVGCVKLNIIPFGSREIPVEKLYSCVVLKLKSQYSDKFLSIKAVEVPEICIDVLPVPNPAFGAISHLQLADVTPHNSDIIAGISLLIGAEYYQSVLVGETEEITERLTAVNTKLGWTLHGPAEAHIMNKSSTRKETLMLVNSLDFNLENFWKLETIGIHNGIETKNNDFFRKFLVQSIKHKGERYEVSLPWKMIDSKLDDNYAGAKSRMRLLTQRLARSEQKLFEYDKAMWDLIKLGIVEVANEPSGQRIYYLPHRAVYRDDKTTTRVRIVFDASAHRPEEASLNDHLHQGPNLLPDLFSILLDFRIGQIGIVADIEKAFMQISINEEDRDAHRFLWYAEPLKSSTRFPPIQRYRFTRVTFGVNCSPFLLNAVIKKHLLVYDDQFQKTIEILAKHLYVDDLVTSVNTRTAAATLYKTAKTIMSEASMNLRKWNSNDSSTREMFMAQRDHENTTPNQKVLGCIWCTRTDELKIDLGPTINFINPLPSGTKRVVLKTMARIYDPLGLLGPFVVRMKVLMQTIWKLKPEWDEVLPESILKEWQQWCSELLVLNEFYIPRCVSSISLTEKDDVQLHLFCDASPKAYGVVAFVRREKPNGEVSSNILCAKHRVAPLSDNNSNELSLPKLELTAALLASRLKSFICDKTSFAFNTIWFWSDSKITLCWIKGSKRWKQYISNRVNEIKLHSSGKAWRYCPGSENPADLLTRGVSANKLVDSEVWRVGPTWLVQSQSFWPVENQFENVSLVNISLSDNNNSEVTERVLNIENFSSFIRLLRVTAYVFRFIYNARKGDARVSGDLTVSELQTAQNHLISSEQQRYFANEIGSLQRGNIVDRQSKLLTLCPHLDAFGILRLGGRLQEIDDETNVAHPIILPKESYLSLLYVRYAHKETLHGGINVALTYIRKTFWILKARQLIKMVINKCVICKRLFSKPAAQPFAPIPRDRLYSARVFETTGVDFAGPMFVKREETSQSDKVYLMLFTCAVVRAVHIELVPALSTECCINAIRRFIARRGHPKIIYSDNAKTFKRVDHEIQRLYKQITTDEISSFAANHGIQWKFIVERAPWWGGWWERLIRTTKNSLKATIGRKLLSYEHLETTLVEVEAVINSRPLTYVSEDPSELKPLSPSDFLSGTAATLFRNAEEITQLPRDDIINIWKQRQKHLNTFWKRWTSEYLHQLRSAHQTPYGKTSNVKINDIVLISDIKTPRLLWRLGKIVNVYPGRDGRVRACELVLANGKTLRRPIQLLYPLEIQ